MVEQEVMVDMAVMADKEVQEEMLRDTVPQETAAVVRMVEMVVMEEPEGLQGAVPISILPSLPQIWIY